jgi:hypothetical protein
MDLHGSRRDKIVGFCEDGDGLSCSIEIMSDFTGTIIIMYESNLMGSLKIIH